MSITRAQMRAYLAARYRALLAEAQISTVDEANTEGAVTTLKDSLDAAFRALGTSEDDLSSATSSDVEAAQALGEYHTLRAIRAALAVRSDFQAANVKTPRSQPFNQVSMLLDDAAARCEALGYSVAGSQAMTLSRLNLDFIEPEVT